jgi:hypothetical protein
VGGRSSYLSSDESAKPIPVSAAEAISKKYGFDQVVIIARKVGAGPDQIAEHVTTYGKDKANCDVAAQMGNFLKYKVMSWLTRNEIPSDPNKPFEKI